MTITVIVALLVSAMDGVGIGRWEGYIQEPHGNGSIVLTDKPLFTHSTESTNHAELSFSTLIDSISPPTPAKPYYTLTVGTTAAANTYLQLGYSCGSIFSTLIQVPGGVPGGGALVYPTNNLQDNEGILVSFPTYDAGAGAQKQWVFPFYGKFYDRVFISANGFLLFGQPPDLGLGQRTSDTTWTSPNVGSFPLGQMPNGIVAPYWRDLKPNLGGAIRWGLIANADSNSYIFEVLWDAVPSVEGRIESFGVYLFVDGEARDGHGLNSARIQFVYDDITLEYDYDVKMGEYYPAFSIGIENQFGNKGVSLVNYYSQIGPMNQPSYNKAFPIWPSPGNRYRITDVKITAQKSDQAGGVDPVADVIVTGQFETVPGNADYSLWGGSNIELSTYTPWSPMTYSDYKNRANAKIAAMLFGAIPIAGQVYSWAGTIWDIYLLTEEYKHANRVFTGWRHQLDYDSLPAFASNLAQDGVLKQNNRATDLWDAPGFEWRLNLPTSGLLTTEHILTLKAAVNLIDDSDNSLPTLVTAELKYKIDKGKLAVFNDDFNDGELSGAIIHGLWDPAAAWTPTIQGTSSLVEFSSAKADASLYTDDFGDWSVRDWTLTSTSQGSVALDPKQGAKSAPSLKVDKVGSGISSATFDIPEQTDHVFYQGSFKVDSGCPTATSGFAGIKLKQGDQARVYLAFKDGYITYNDGSFHNIQQFYPNSWYTIGLEVRVIDGSYDIWINGAKTSFSPSLIGTGPYRIDSMCFEAAPLSCTNPDCTLWIDDLNVVKDTSVHLKYLGSANMARMKSPEITTFDRTKDYSMCLNYYGASNNYVVIADDGRIELVNTMRIDPISHLSVSYLCANTPSGLQDIFPFYMNTWHRVVVHAYPNQGAGQYYVSLDSFTVGGNDAGPFSMKAVTSSPYALSFGSKSSPASTEGGEGYWDDFIVATSDTPAPLDAQGTATPTEGIAPLEVSFTCTPLGGTPSFSYVWDFNDGGMSTEQSPKHTYISDGTYVATVTVTDLNGDTDYWNSPIISVISPPVPGPPVTSATVSGTAGLNGWYISAVTVTLTAKDSDGISATYYKIDSAKKWTTYGNPFSVPNGKHVVTYYSVDKANNQETPAKMTNVWVDPVTPTTTATLNAKRVMVTLSVTDVPGAVVTIHYKLDSGAWVTYTGTSIAIKTTKGTHTILYYAGDQAGWIEAQRTLTFTF